jgi:murein endopeptidase
MSRISHIILAASLLAAPATAAPGLVDSLAPEAGPSWLIPLWRGIRTPDDPAAEAAFQADMARLGTEPARPVPEIAPATEVVESAQPAVAQATPERFAGPQSVSIGKPNGGWLAYPARIHDSHRFIARERSNFGTREMVAAIEQAVDRVFTVHGSAHPLVIGDLSKRHGGPFRPHKSHQAGTDADIGYYFVKGITPDRLKAATPRIMDTARTWTFVESMLENDQVEYIFTHRRLERSLYKHARDVVKLPPEKLARYFSYPNSNKTGVLRHLRGHDDHLHIRFHAPKSVLAVASYVAKHGKKAVKPLPVYAKIRRGDSLWKIARRHRASVKKLTRWNRISRRKTLRPGKKLIVGWARPKLPEPGS